MASVAHIIRRRRARKARQRQQRQTRRVLSTVLGGAALLLFILPMGGAVAVALSYYAQFSAGVPTNPQQNLALDPLLGASQLYDRTGQTLLWTVEDPLGDERTWLPLDAVPDAMVQATLLREDPDFLQTAAFRPAQTARTLFSNHFTDPNEEPAPPDPTLTGRLVRNALAPPPEPVTAAYRAREHALVAEVNRRFTPQQVLEWHLNTNYYGNNAYGVAAAAQVYFGKTVHALTLDEMAMLAAIPTLNNTAQYNPLDDEVAARGRQGDVLRDLMLNGYINEGVYANAVNTITPIAGSGGQRPLVAPEYAQYARRQAETILNAQGYNGTRLVARGGLTIITALDMDLHAQATCTLNTHLAALGGGTPPPPCAAIAYLPAVSPITGAAPDAGAITLIDVDTGELLAVVGDVTADNRQPGPVLYPFVYLRAFSTGLTTPARMVLDVPLRFPGMADGLIYTPTNPDGTFRGPVNLRAAMGAGLLPPAAQVTSTEGLDGVQFTARQIGMSSLDLPTLDLSMLERGGSVSVLDATYAYSVFGALGEMRGVLTSGAARPRNPVAVLEIRDAEGAVLWAYDDTERLQSTTPIMDGGLSYLVNNILADQSTRAGTLGTENILAAPRPTAVVYGTAGGGHNWTVGYTPHLAVGVWLGRTDDSPVALPPYGVDGAGAVWRALLDYTHDRDALPPDDWQPPDNIVEARVCERTGLRPNDACPQLTEIFLDGTVPQDVDTYWERVAVNSENGLLATANTPASLREEQVFFVPPTEALEWWETNQLPLPPTEFDTLTRPELVQSTVILRPALLDYVSGQVDVRGSMDADNLQYYQIAYGEGLNPTEWIAITEQRPDYTPGATLGTWDTTGLDGLYNLRLSAVMNDDTIDPVIIQVTVDNVPPAITLAAGEPGQVFTFLNNDVIPLSADAQDNVAIDYVEFYHNGEFVGADETFPFGYEHPIERVGRETFSAVVFDAAGNQSSAETVVEVLRGGT